MIIKIKSQLSWWKKLYKDPSYLINKIKIG
jgi:hypothetical protein